MTVLGVSLSASAWLAPMTALAVMSSIAAVILLRDHLQLERHTIALEAQLARLQDEMQRRSWTPPRLDEPASAHVLEPSIARSLRAPLGGIAGLATLLLDTPLNGEQIIHVRRIKVLAEDLAAQVEPALPAPAKPAIRPRKDKTVRVLLAEDNEINGLFAVQALEMSGAVVQWARDGEEALAAIEASFSGKGTSYDVVLMDLRMPRVNGLEATRRVRALEARLRRHKPMRIVAVTASTMPQDRLAAEAAGIDDFLAKPYRADALVRVLTPRMEKLAEAS